VVKSWSPTGGGSRLSVVVEGVLKKGCFWENGCLRNSGREKRYRWKSGKLKKEWLKFWKVIE